MGISTATVGLTVFTLVEECGRYRWTWPDGSPTGLSSSSVEDARRAMAFRGIELAREWNERYRPVPVTAHLAVKMLNS